MRFSRLRSSRSRHSSDSFDINTDHCVDELKRLLVSSGVSQVSIHVEVEGNIQRKTLHGPQSQPSADFDQRSHGSQSRVSATDEPHLNLEDPSQTTADTNVDEIGAKTIYAIASLTKILINVAYSKLIFRGVYRSKGLSWDKSACDLLNEIRGGKGKSLIRRVSRDPTIIELLLHRNGFAPINRVLFAPDGTFLVSEDDFLEIAPHITEEYFKGGQQGWIVYSNANTIFAGMILEELTGQKLSEIMQEVVFSPIQMANTVMDTLSLHALETAGATIAEGHRVSGDMNRSIPLLERKYLADTVEVASLGARSCTEDLAKLIREFLKALDNLSDEFQEQEVLDFFGPKCDGHDGGKVALGGLQCALNTTLPGHGSLSRMLVPSDVLPPYKLGRQPSGSPNLSYYTAGSIDGFASTMYVSLSRRAFVIVLANSTSPMDVTDHIARYILQGVLELSPPVNVVSNAIEEGRRASRKVQEYEREDSDFSAWSDDIQSFVGIYENVKFRQELEISTGGDVILRGRSKSSSKMKARASGSTLRIFPGTEGFGIERWSVWENRDFEMQERNHELFLVGVEGGDLYKRKNLS
jgi:CubicO group peptidase (beta-lactamase class C family)